MTQPTQSKRKQTRLPKQARQQKMPPLDKEEGWPWECRLEDVEWCWENLKPAYKVKTSALQESNQRRHEQNLKLLPPFFDALLVNPSISAAADNAGLSRGWLSNWRARSETFDNMVIRYQDVGISALEDEACRRAFEGDAEPIYNSKGFLIGEKRKRSDILLMFYLKAHRPEKYRERSEQQITQTTELRVGGVNRDFLLQQVTDRLAVMQRSLEQQQREGPPTNGNGRH